MAYLAGAPVGIAPEDRPAFVAEALALVREVATMATTMATKSIFLVMENRGPTRNALRAALRIVLAGCPEGRVPLAFVAGPQVFALATLHQAAAELGVPLGRCAATCPAPDDVMLLTTPIDDDARAPWGRA
jgi:hypothetical protein